ncbi:MAG TPA: hypothetical protein VGL38_01065 [bacterium]
MKQMIVTVCTALLFISAAAIAQPPAVQWTHSYTLDVPVPNAIIQTLDGGYAVAGVSQIYTPYFQKVDSLGAIQWRTFSFAAGTARGHAAKEVIQNPDSSYALVGTNYYNPWDARYWFVSKVSPSGGNVWANVVTNGFAYGDPWSLERCGDGGYVVGGEAYAGLMRVSTTGQNLFERLYDGDLRYVKPLSDGTYTGGGNNLNSATAPDFYLVHTDLFGTMSWQHTYALPGGQICYGMDATRDGGYILVGSDSLGLPTNDLDMFVMKVNSAGDTLWTRRYNAGYSDYAWDVRQTQDGGYILLAYNGSAGMLMKINSAGDSLWSTYANAWALSPTADGGYIVAGFNPSQLILTKYAPDLAPPSPPQSLTVNATDTGLTLRWHSVPNATSYEVYSAASVSGPYLLDHSGTFADTTWTSPVAAGQKYYYVAALR